MADYVHGSSWSYKDFLQAKEFNNAIDLAIEKQTLSLIATERELAADGAKVVADVSRESTDRLIAAGHQQAEHVAGAINDQTALNAQGFTILHYDLQQVREGIDSVEEAVGRVEAGVEGVSAGIERLGALFDWRIAEVVGRLGALDTSLQTLIRLAKTPSQTWAYEQFEIARIALGRGLYREAMTYVDQAINGFGSHTGFPLEPRFHYLRGTIHLTSSEDEGLLDVAAAEAAFERGARVAAADDRSMASSARCAVGYAAYCQGAFDRSRQNINSAKALDEHNVEALYLSGKLFAREGSDELATGDLSKALMFDRRFAARAGADGDYRSRPDVLRRAIASVREVATQRVGATVDRTRRVHSELRSAIDRLSAIAAPTPTTILARSARVDQLAREVDDWLTSRTLYGSTEAQRPAGQIAVTLEGVRNDVLVWTEAAIKGIPDRERDAISALEQQVKVLPKIPDRGPLAATPQSPYASPEVKESTFKAFRIAGLLTWLGVIILGYHIGQGAIFWAIFGGWIWGLFGGLLVAGIAYLAKAAAVQREQETARRVSTQEYGEHERARESIEEWNARVRSNIASAQASAQADQATILSIQSSVKNVALEPLGSRRSSVGLGLRPPVPWVKEAAPAVTGS
jgi:tetratricopeptide (TPR) repeat protein